MNACTYGLAYVCTGWCKRRAFAPVFLAFVLRAKVFAAVGGTRLIHLVGPVITAKQEHQDILTLIAQGDGSDWMLCRERPVYTRFNTAGLDCCFALLSVAG